MKEEEEDAHVSHWISFKEEKKRLKIEIFQHSESFQ